MMTLDQFMILMQTYGVIDVFLPFLLIFSIIFISTQTVKILNKNTRTILSIVIALLTVFPHVTNSYPPCWDIIDIINSALPRVALLIVGITTFLIMLAIIGIGTEWSQGVFGIITICALGFVVYIFLTSRPLGCPSIQIPVSPSVIRGLIGIGVIIAIVSFISGGGPIANQDNN